MLGADGLLNENFGTISVTIRAQPITASTKAKAAAIEKIQAATDARDVRNSQAATPPNTRANTARVIRKSLALFFGMPFAAM